MTSNKDIWKPIHEDEDLELGETTANNKNNKKTQQAVKWVLIEIVSALRVPSMDARSAADPFVSVTVGGKEVHRTKSFRDDPNPIWTIENGSLFVLQLDKPDYYGKVGTSSESKDGNPVVDLKTETVTFTVKDYDALQKSKTIGTVEIKLKDLIKGKGKRKEYTLDVPQKVQDFNKKRKRKIGKKAKLVLRFKPPSVEELHFIQTLRAKSDGIFAHETYLPPSKSTVISEGGGPQIKGWGAQLLGTASSGAKKNADAVLQKALEPSLQWIDVGSGDEGRVFLEVISCDGLPNLDSPTLMNPNNLTDPFCNVILEDSIVNTSIIKDTLSPRWLPSDRRAFVFHVHHPSSQVHVGVFDHDKINRPGASLRAQVHDPIGRVLINLTQFRPDTLYTLQYHLYMVDKDSEKNREEQTTRGSITIRLRIEWGETWCQGYEMKNMIVAGMTPPPPSYLSVPTKYDFQAARYTIEGDHDSSKFNLNTLTGYVEELQGFVDEDVVELVIDAILTVVLWRGHYHVHCCGRILRLPLHSIAAFTWGILVTQNYNRFLSFSLFAIGWFFLTTMEHRGKHPSPWHRCVSYSELFGAVLAGSFCGCIGSYLTLGSQSIAANENLPAIQSYYAAVKDRKIMQTQQQEQAIKREAELKEAALKNEVDDNANMAMDVAIATATREGFMSSMHPLKPILHPLQKILYDVVVYIRVAKSIVMWEENYYPFWIVTGSFVGSLLVFFIPWGWVLRWTLRLLVWVCLGPWMKIVDWLYFVRKDKMTPEERKELAQQELHERYEQTLAERLVSQKRKEQAVKLKSMMKYLFGKFVLRVPRFRKAQFLDYPLPASTAEPCQGGIEVATVGQICGQTLTGDMIPRRMVQEHPFLTHAAVESNSPEAKLLLEETMEGEAMPLLSKTKKKKHKLYGLFRKRW